MQNNIPNAIRQQIRRVNRNRMENYSMNSSHSHFEPLILREMDEEKVM